MSDQDTESQAIRPEVVTQPEPEQSSEPVTEPTKLIRIASMTRAMLEEVRQAELDESGRERLKQIHQQSLAELREVLSEDLAEEFDEIFKPLDGAPSESVIRIAQAQLIGWLEGLFHGIQATLFSQQMAARAQLQELQQTPRLGPGERDDSSGLYL